VTYVALEPRAQQPELHHSQRDHDGQRFAYTILLLPEVQVVRSREEQNGTSPVPW